MNMCSSVKHEKTTSFFIFPALLCGILLVKFYNEPDLSNGMSFIYKKCFFFLSNSICITNILNNECKTCTLYSINARLDILDSQYSAIRV